jgi:ketosteroid isomerase-like protein
MAQHPNEKLLVEIYAKFAEGDVGFLFSHCTPDMVWTVPGKAPHSGIFSNETFVGALGKVMEISGGTFGEAVVHCVANDEKGVVVADHWLTRDGKKIEYRTDHIWGFRDGKLISFEERAGNQEEFERAWS